MFGKEAIAVARLYACGCAAIAAAGMQALTRRDNRQVRRHHTGFTQLTLVDAVTPAFMPAAAKIFRRDAGDRAANAWVGQRQTRVGEIWLTSTHRKRSNKAAPSMEVINHCDIRDIDDVYAIETASVPGIKRIMRANGEPSDGAKAEARMMSEADKEDEGRRPQRTVVDVNRSRPPAPIIAVIKPPSIVIWRPAPRLITYPGPAVIGLPNPSSRLIWGPRCFLIRLPDVAISGDINPPAVLIKIIHAGVITVRMADALLRRAPHGRDRYSRCPNRLCWARC